MSLTFKQYHAFLEMQDDDPQLDEIFGMFKNNEEKAKAEREKLELQASRGNEVAKMKLRDLQMQDDKASAAKSSKAKADDQKFKTAKAYADASDKGRSDAYAKETGSLGKKKQPVWDRASGKWVDKSDWGHVGKHD